MRLQSEKASAEWDAAVWEAKAKERNGNTQPTSTGMELALVP